MNLYVGDIGQPITQITNIDWTSNTSKTCTILRPDGTKVTKTGSSVNVDDASSGTVRVVTGSGDLNQSGTYLVQFEFTTASNTIHCPIMHFEVSSPLA